MSRGRRSRPKVSSRQPSPDEAVRRELEFHLEGEVERLVAEGMDRADAWTEVKRRTGPLSPIERKCVRLQRQRHRRRKRAAALNGIIHDLRTAVRALSRRPGFTFASVLMIVLGLGPATSLLTVVDTILVRQLPYPAADELLRISSTGPSGPIGPIPGPMFLDWQRLGVSPFASVAAILVERLEIPAQGGTPERIKAGAVSAAFGPMFGLQPALGRWFTPEDDRQGAPRVVVLAHHIWKQRWNADPGLIGRSVTLDGHPVIVVGVAPADFHPPEALGLTGTDAWVPLAQAKQDLTTHNNWFLRVVARLPSNVAEVEARQQLQSLTDRLVANYPGETWDGREFTLQTASLRDLTIGGSRTTLTPFLLAVPLLLLTASINLAHLNLARGRERRADLAMRGALGAGYRRLLSHVVMESVLIGIVGFVIAVIVAHTGVRVLQTMSLTSSLPRLAEITIDLRVLLGAGLVLIIAGIGFALLPALATVRGAYSHGMARTRIGSQITQSGRNVLVSAEVGFALILLVAASLLGTSYWNLAHVDPGFAVDRVWVVNITLRDRYTSRDQREAAYQSIRNQIASIPTVGAAGSVIGLPFGDTGVGGVVVIDGRPANADGRPNFVRWGMADEGFYRALGISPLPGGQLPSPAQYTMGAHAAVVNQAYVSAYLDGREPIGSRLKVGRTGDDAPWWEVVGVVEDVKQGRLDRAATPEVYLTIGGAHFVFPTMEFIVRTRPGAEPNLAEFRNAVWAFDPNQPIGWIAPLSERITDSIITPRFHAGLLAVMAGTALALAMAGVFSTVAHAVGQRQREIAIRRALGATADSVRTHVVRGSFAWVLLGLAVGLAGSYPLGRILESMLFGIGGVSVTIYVAAISLLSTLALLASYVPAHWASQVDPVTALTTDRR